ncbi:MAG: diaminopimelate decarboxylase [Acidobacteria bacterium]|nr:diaminopimelate decarboxylase [Acidobacteriota bacterium]
MERAPGFVYSRVGKNIQRLSCERVSLLELARRFGTPLYVYSAQAIRERVQAFTQAFSDVEHLICYSVKANSNLGILRLLSDLGCGFDVVSGGEIERVRRLGQPACRKVVFSGVGKTVPEIEAALEADILMFNVESASELSVLARCAAKLKRRARIALRVNPDVSAATHPYISTGLQKHKFGVPLGEARKLYTRAAQSKYLQVAGVSLHIGSQITDYAPFAAAMEIAAELVRQLNRDGHRIRYIDCGGGLGIDYRHGQASHGQSISGYAEAIIGPLADLPLRLLLEPGRSIVGPAGVLLTHVLYRKINGEKKFVVVDAAMNDLIRPSLYQAEHQIVPVSISDCQPEIVDIVGPICESGDYFARDRSVPAVKEGELLAILDAGAYGMSLASNYNSRPRPAEVLVDRGRVRLIRKRETISDLLALERVGLKPT